MRCSRMPRGGLPRAERLRAAGDFERLFRRGARVERPGFVLLWVPAPGPRAVGFVVSRRLGGSVARNRVRRRLREAFRRVRAEFPSEGFRLCFVARGAVVGAPFEEIVTQVRSALHRVARHPGPR